MLFFNRFSTSVIADFVIGSYPSFSKSKTKTRFREYSIFSGLSGEGYLQLKRIMDIVFGIPLLILSLPILALCAIVTKLDSPGPVIFVQKRTGKGGKQFNMFKLRTMVTDADLNKHKFAHLNSQSYPDFKITNDPRITKIGRLLRKTSLDELPQIFNVILGDMSLVGPRPTSFPPSTYDLWHTARLEIRPGITGLWQVSGRCEVGFNARCRLDIAYLRNLSLWFDIKILLRTFGSVINQDGAE